MLYVSPLPHLFFLLSLLLTDSLSLLLSSPPFLPSHLHSPHAPLLCVLLLHLCSDYSSIGSHADVAIGRYADLAIDTHKQPRRCLRGTANFQSGVIFALFFVLGSSRTKDFDSKAFFFLFQQKRQTEANTVAIWKKNKQISSPYPALPLGVYL